jgi:hypothetical protein
VVTRVVMRLLAILGWDLTKPQTVYEEYPAIPGQEAKKVDLALFASENTAKPELYIEVKRHGLLQNPEEERRAEEQLWEYDKFNRVKLALLTDGQIWHFYHPLATGSYSDRRAYTLDLLTRSEDDCALYLELLLSFAAVSNGSAFDQVKKLHEERAHDENTRQAFPEVWKSLLSDPSPLFLDSIGNAFQQLKGISPNQKLLKEMLGELPMTGPSVISPGQARDLDVRAVDNLGSSNEEGDYQFGGGGRASQTRIRVQINWKLAGKSYPTEILCDGMASHTMVKVVERLLQEFGPSTLDKLSRFTVRGVPFVSRKRSPMYNQSELGNTGYLVMTHSSNPDNITHLAKIVSVLSQPRGFLTGEVVGR